MSLGKVSLFVALAVVGLGHSAQAGFIQQTMNYGPSTTPFSDPLTFNSFNTSLGTLTSVNIILTESGSVTSEVINLNANGSSNYSGVTSTGTVMVTGPDATAITASFTTNPVSGSVSTYGVITPVGTMSGSATSSSTVSNFVPYEGASPFTYTINAVGSVTTTGTSNNGLVGFIGTATLGGSVEIDYTYTPSVIPEPASFVMVALGLSGVFAARRYRRRAV